MSETQNNAITYQVYSAGGMFNQHELSSNIFIKEAVQRLSNNKYQFVLPQSIVGEEQDAAKLRNISILDILKADIILARFDGLELDSGTVAEFCIAKFLGKPAVILRTDNRLLSNSAEQAKRSPDEPYNLMLKGWPRTSEVHIQSLPLYIQELIHAQSQNESSSEEILQAELQASRSGIDKIAQQIIEGFEEVLQTKSNYPAQLQEQVYELFRHCPGSGFEELLSGAEFDQMIENFREKGTL